MSIDEGVIGGVLALSVVIYQIVEQGIKPIVSSIGERSPLVREIQTPLLRWAAFFLALALLGGIELSEGGSNLRIVRQFVPLAPEWIDIVIGAIVIGFGGQKTHDLQKYLEKYLPRKSATPVAIGDAQSGPRTSNG